MFAVAVVAVVPLAGTPYTADEALEWLGVKPGSKKAAATGR
jgi:hypothetical protein